jgi:hypothetical protein
VSEFVAAEPQRNQPCEHEYLPMDLEMSVSELS